MSDRQAQQSGQGSSNDDQKGFFEQISSETAAIKNLEEIETALSKDLTGIGTQLLRLRDESESEERNEKIEACVQKIRERVESFRQTLSTYRAIDIRGPWSLRADVQRAVSKQSSDLESLNQQWITFFGSQNENKALEDANGIIARWLQQAHSSTKGVMTAMRTTMEDLSITTNGAMEGQSHLLEQIIGHVDQIRDDVRTDRNVLNQISDEIKALGKTSAPDLQKWLDEVGERIQKAAALDSVEERLDVQKPILDEVSEKLDILKKMGEGIALLNSKPVFDNQMLIDIHAKMEELSRQGDPHPKLDVIHKGMVTMIQKQDINEDIRDRVKAMAATVEQFQKEERPDLADMKANLRHIEGQLSDLQRESPEEYSQKLDEVTALLNQARVNADEHQKKLDELNKHFEELQKRPEIDPERLREMENVLHEIRNRSPLPDFDSAFKGFSQKLKDHTEATQAGFQTVNSNLEETKGDLKDINVDLRKANTHLGTIAQDTEAMDQHLGSVDQHLGSVDQHLGSMNKHLGSMDKSLESLEGVSPKLDAARNDLKSVKGQTESLNLDVQGVRGLLKDHSENIKTEFSKVHKNLEDVKARPALNTEFTDIHGQVGQLSEALGQYQTTSVLEHLEGIHKDFHDNPILGMNPNDIQDGFKGIRKMIEEHPPVDQQPVMDQLADIKHQTDVTSENLASLKGVAQDTHYLRNRPYLGPNDLREFTTPLHKKIDNLRAPLTGLEGSVLTQDYFDQRLPAAAFTEDRDRSKAILDTLHETKNHVIQIGERPGFNPQPVNSLHRDVTQLQMDHKNNIEALKAQMETVPHTVGAKMNEMKSEVRQDMNQLTSQLAQMNEQQAESSKNMKLLKNLSLGAAVLSGVTLVGVLGALVLKPLFGKKKQKAAAAANEKRRLHARWWGHE